MTGINDTHLRAFLDAAPDAMVIADSDGLIVFMNVQAENLFAYERAELLGRSVEMLLPERFRGRHSLHRAEYAHAPTARPMGAGLELFARRSDGSEFPAEISLSPIRTGDGLFISSAIRDVTGRRAIERELVEARCEAEQANRAKSVFLAAASHDLRQPLQTLTMLGAVLNREVPAGTRAGQAVAGQAQALESMGSLLNSLLDISKLEAGAVKPDISDFEIRSILERLDGEFSALAAEKGIEFKVDSCDCVVRSDPTLLMQIVQNLVANAIRYTREGWVRLRCTGDSGMLCIEVADSGAGIPPKDIERIFDEFYQGKAEPGERRQGLGLGLSIVRRLTDLLGHPLELESSVGRGTRFMVTVPSDSAMKPARAPARAERAGAIVHREGAVLIIDDDQAVADATAMLLDVLGMETVVADGIEQARTRLINAGRVPSLILCDFRLGNGETGLDAVQVIRDAAQICVPAILISGDTSFAARETLQGVENCNLLSKPVDADELLALIDGIYVN